MKYKDLLSKSTDYLIKNNNEESIALYLLEYISGKTSPVLFASLDNECKEEEEKRMEDALKEVVINNRPVQYVIGEAPFYGYNFKVNENVLIPRFETEELVENVLLKYDELFKGKKVDVCDVATGSGCIGITLKLEEPNFNMTITDISSEALEVAKHNAKTLGAEVRILQGDMLEPLKGMKFDILVSNPPYIPTTENVMSLVKDNEPNIALFGGSDGMKFYRIILSGAKNLLNEKALIAFEHGYDKKEEMLKLAREYFPNAKVEVLKDMQGKDRMTLIEIGF
ncbi:MAG: peptide chain release factor N(5)-glutamine methyltransferase [Anaeroplasmataceae bacterium]